MHENSGRRPNTPSASIVIPAQNEERTIGRLLTALSLDASDGEFDIVVVCNGCTDGTAAAARASIPWATVLEIEQPSKSAAMRSGDQVAKAFPRVYLDADVVLDANAIRAILGPLATGQVLAAAPSRIVSRDRASLLVNWYYDVWEALPQVETGLFGRGVVALSSEGHKRFSKLPELMSDDLAMSEVFDTSEREVVTGASVVVHPPRTLRDLVKRRIRVTTGNAQAQTAGVRRSESKTSIKTLAGIVKVRPAMIPRMPVFLGVTLIARFLSRRAVRSGDFTTWQRDESSRR